ncbi:MAG: hypothetical protein WAW85_09325 [Gordonia sp. (in: high G+C Gram-positive bacteria)]|uniref:hypothetical protein n=1 Tax=Gordonia sp. (in: high G+C Gram-positive bacteria) TaxID=84139 RepID=UPI003BB7F920
MAVKQVERKDAERNDADKDDTEQKAAEQKAAEPDEQSSKDGSSARVVSVATLTRTVVVAVAVIAVVVAIGILSWQLASAKSDLSERNRQAAASARAEQVALDYAVGAADMDFRDPGTWRKRLTEGTSPELAERLNKAATSMDQIIQPLQWTTVSEPIAAKVESSSDGVYQVVAFVDMLTTNTQRPDGVQSTATYRLTIDSGQDWQITDISELPSALGEQEQPK